MLNNLNHLKTCEEFKKDVHRVHRDKYKVIGEYKGNHIPILLQCNKCNNDFLKTPNNLIHQKQDCRCYNDKALDKRRDKFIEGSIKVHGNKYNYDLVEYVNNNTNVIIYCNRCEQSFTKQPIRHYNRKIGCPNCSPTKKITIDNFIKRSVEVHGNKYDYTHYKLVNDATKSDIKCNSCKNIFQQSLMNHVRNKQGCPYCNGGVFVPYDTQVKKALEKHQNKYEYIKPDDYKGASQKIDIICPTHGLFKMHFNNHLQGQGCPRCKKHKIGITKEMFLERADDDIEYDLTDYVNAQSVIKISCPVHGWYNKIAIRHLQGQGCPTCKQSKGEQYIFNRLKENDIEFIQQARLSGISHLPFDFKINNILIEYDGIQHYEAVEFFGGKKALDSQQHRDLVKTNYCELNGYTLYRIRYDSDLEKEIDDIIRTIQNVFKTKE